MKAPLKVSLVGVGRMGQNHLRVLSMLKGVELTFLADVDEALAQRLAAAYGVPGGGHPAAALDGADAVIICTPTMTHAEYIRMAAKKVRNIFVEKPMAGTLAEAEAIAAIAARQELNLQVGFIERFNPAVLGLKSIIDKAQRVISIDFTRTNKLSARITDVDVVTDLMVHDIDLALYLNGPAKSVVAHGFARESMIDFASALITHDNGRFSRIQASRVTDKKVRLIEATCLDMFVDCELLRKEIIINRQSEIRQREGQPYTISAIQETIEVRPQEALLSELQAFIASCREGGRDGLPTADAGLAAMRICEQIQRAVVA
ncbi:Gfo/Idh/MocA family oxidoreductase [Ramlibacter sp. RBP-2]|uniref:Gfo/Idh/MocA family oxidoreductase n=1 Tax=Ramlibacter lithotrophicus TaxID=2606681 RepID=A0A7X6DK87_9BURK|nr:Gfo/Idh/MocA family oxidoreductase [Ramlibacter lithotrophicus]NKE68712.1 Gfo/Idh/MocA family oxidoreductase [Ramlibacter lithotrophicus]